MPGGNTMGGAGGGGNGDAPASGGSIGVPRFILAGDSKASLAAGLSTESWLHYALALSGVAYKFDPATDNRGINGATADTDPTITNDAYGQQCPIGFGNDTTVGKLVERVAARVAEGDDVVVWFQLGTNEPDNDTQVIPALRKAINACRAAGAKLFLVNDVPPAGVATTTATAASFQSTNARLALLAASEPDVKHLRMFEATLDPASANSNSLGGSAGGAFAATRDGIHESAYGAYLEGRALAPQIKAIFPAAEIRYGGPGDVYQAYYGGGAYPATGLAANLLKNPFFAGTAGTDSTTKAGTAAVIGAVPDTYNMSGALTGDVAVTLSQVDSADLNERFGRSDFKALRLALSGTPTANGTLLLAVNQTTPALHALVNGVQKTQTQILVRANALAGTVGVGLRVWGAERGINGNNGAAHQQLPALTDLLLAQGEGSVAPGGGPPDYIGIPEVGVSIYMRSGVPLSGSLDLLWCDARLVPDLQAAMA